MPRRRAAGSTTWSRSAPASLGASCVRGGRRDARPRRGSGRGRGRPARAGTLPRTCGIQRTVDHRAPARAQRRAVPELPPTLNGTPTDRIARALASRMRAASPLRPGERATVVFDTGPDAWTLGFDAEGASLCTRRVRSPDAVLLAPGDGMAGLNEGTR